VVSIHLPPLRERKEDIPDLVGFFLKKYAAESGVENPSIHPGAMEFLKAQSWPGNVREMENVVRKVLLQAQGYTISTEHIRAALTRTGPPPALADKSIQKYVDELIAAAEHGEIVDARARLQETVERALFSRALAMAQGNQVKASRWLGVSRQTLREKMVLYGLHPDRG
jgi:DNA-binding NtrC family response regulator